MPLESLLKSEHRSDLVRVDLVRVDLVRVDLVRVHCCNGNTLPGAVEE